MYKSFIYQPKSGDRVVKLKQTVPFVRWTNGCRHVWTTMPVVQVSSPSHVVREALRRFCRECDSVAVAWDERGQISLVFDHAQGVEVFYQVFPDLLATTWPAFYRAGYLTMAEKLAIPGSAQLPVWPGVMMVGWGGRGEYCPT